MNQHALPALAPLSNLVATLHTPANVTSNDSLGIWLVSGAEQARAALCAQSSPGTHQRRASIKHWLPAQQVKAAAVFGRLTAHKADVVRKLHHRFEWDLLRLVLLIHLRAPHRPRSSACVAERLQHEGADQLRLRRLWAHFNGGGSGFIRQPDAVAVGQLGPQPARKGGTIADVTH